MPEWTTGGRSAVTSRRAGFLGSLAAVGGGLVTDIGGANGMSGRERGSARDREVRLDHPTVSARHTRIVREEARLALRDEGSPRPRGRRGLSGGSRPPREPKLPRRGR